MERKQKVVKPIKDVTFTLILGLFLILLNVVLILDIGYISRTANFLPFFFLGIGAYVVYALVALRGIIYVLLGRRFKFKHKWFALVSLIIILIGVSGVITISLQKQTIEFNNLWVIYTSHYQDYYDNIHVPFVFRAEESSIGGGIIGYALVACLNKINLGLTSKYVIFSLVIFIGVLVFALPYIIKKIQDNKGKEKPAKVKKSKPMKEIPEILNQQFEFEETKNEESPFDMEERHQTIKQPLKRNKEPDSFYVVKDKSKEIIKNASKVSYEAKADTKEFLEDSEIPTVSKIVEEKPNNTSEKHITFSESGYNRVGGLEPVHFIRSDVSFESHIVNPDNGEPSIQEGGATLADAKVDSVIKEEHVEQMELDFSDAPKEMQEIKVTPAPIDPNLVTARPEFSDPVVVKKENELQQKEADKQVNPVNNPTSFASITHKFIEPSLDLLNDYETSAAIEKNEQVAEQRKNAINDIFQTFNVHAECIGYVIGPSVTRYNIGYTETAQFKSVNGLTNDISIRLGGVDARFESIVPGETYSGLEISNAVVTMVGFKDVLESLPPRDEHPMAIAFGKNISGEVIWADLDKTPHMLISGTTGSGKSIFIHSIIMSLIMRNNPDDLRLVLVDPKRVEMSKYKGMPHLLCPNITEPEVATACMNKLVDEMERRYGILEENCVSDIGQYNELRQDKPELERMPYYVAILDEYSDLVDRAKDIQRPIISLAQKARSCGIHLIVCTQRPSTNVITGLIKGNLPTHVALMTASTTDSITIIGEGGAEKLLGKGDMLVQSACVSKMGCVRLQGCFVQNKEILKVVDFLKSTMTTDYNPDFLDLEDHSNDGPKPLLFEQGGTNHSVKVDEAYEAVKESVMCEEYASISRIQRDFGFGFNRSGRIFNQLVAEGIVEKPDQKRGNSRGCRVLVHDSSYGREAEIGSDEVTTTESLNEYIRNGDKADGGY